MRVDEREADPYFLVSSTVHGLVERWNWTLKQMLSVYTNKKQEDWDRFLPSVVFAYNTAEHEGSDISSFELLYGREPRLPLDVGLISDKTATAIHHDDYLQDLKDELRDLQNGALLRIQRSQQRMEARAARDGPITVFGIGDEV